MEVTRKSTIKLADSHPFIWHTNGRRTRISLARYGGYVGPAHIVLHSLDMEVEAVVERTSWLTEMETIMKCVLEIVDSPRPIWHTSKIRTH